MTAEKGILESSIILEKFEIDTFEEILLAANLFFKNCIDKKQPYKGWEPEELEHNFLDFIHIIWTDLGNDYKELY
jgi:hypothetical protein